MSKQWWQFWKSDCPEVQDSNEGRIFVYGYAVTPGSKLHRQAMAHLRLGTDKKLETDVNIELPNADIIDQLVNEWAVLGRGVNTDERRQAMHRREKEIGQTLNKLGGIDLMRAAAYKLINDGLSYESDFYVWHGIGDWQN